ncbi:MAG TPA: GvpL/GvpF family gas vesicle protein [Candidatus Angelobacter sp.]
MAEQTSATSTASRALAYCVFQEQNGIALPTTGVGGAQVREIALGGLRALWSEVEWPFAPAGLQRHAVEFHQVVHQVFARAAVAPFPLLTIFDDRSTLESFFTTCAPTITADLERLHNMVQMECVLYVIGTKAHAGPEPELLQSLEHSLAQTQQAFGLISPDVRVRAVKSGRRIFALVRRGREEEFRAIAESLPLPERISRRTAGPRPAAEFLSQPLRAPNSTEGRANNLGSQP